MEPAASDLSAHVAAIYRAESRRVLATLIRLLGDFDLAEDALQEAFAAALARWPREGVPAQPRAWLVSAGRFRAIDSLRRRTRFAAAAPELAAQAEPAADSIADDSELPDDRLRLIFTCCHPALAPEAQVALTLREVCGLTTEEIAAAFLLRPPAVAQRIVRAKTKIRAARIPYEIPAGPELAARLESVLRVVYLVFNEGYTASGGPELTRADLAGEAVRLTRLLVELLPAAETRGLLALMLFHEARRATRTTAAGDLVLLADQDRTRWDRARIAEAQGLVRAAFAGGTVGAYALQAAIAGAHAEAPTAAATDWARIATLYDLLRSADPSPVVELNRAVAVAMRDGPAAGLALVDDLFARGELRDYRFAHAARADFCRQLGRHDEARSSYRRALELAQQEPERRFLAERLRSLP